MESEGLKQDIQVNGAYLHKFRLYVTYSKFYAIGWDKRRKFWKVLKIDRSYSSELEVYEDPTIYSKDDCNDLLSRINAGNKSIGGLKFVTTFYGIVGFINFLGPHYMLLITKRKKVGSICGHSIYTITKSEMIPVPNSYEKFNMDSSNSEIRYKKLLCMMDLTKDFYFSYSYKIMLSLQKNISKHEVRSPVYETVSVWNEFLSRGIRNQLNSTLWTVALVYGFFKQVKLSVFGREFMLTLIARRSRHYAGTRYLKRGVNEKGHVANDVETEQIVFEHVYNGSPSHISSVVQIRGSIPLFWSQKTSIWDIKPDITLLRNDQLNAATKLHFNDLVYRYGNPIIILNLVKAFEKKPRESILLVEFANALDAINKDLTEEDRLRFLHYDLSKHSKKNAKNALDSLKVVAGNALYMTGFFFCHIIQSSRTEVLIDIASYPRGNGDGHPAEEIPDRVDRQSGKNTRVVGLDITRYCNPQMFQQGVLRTNCIDCLDRTNVAQFCYGLVALGHQFRSLSFLGTPNIDFDSPLADDLAKLYKDMGNALAIQYGGSEAHDTMISERRGQPKVLTRSQAVITGITRYLNNAFMDTEKQDAINVFLGHFRPQHGRPALWELDSDQHFNVGSQGLGCVVERPRSIIRRSLSDINIPSDFNYEQNEDSCQPYISDAQSNDKDQQNETAYSRPSVFETQLKHNIDFDSPDIDFDSALSDDLVKLYEATGDTLAFQYGRSPAHYKMNSDLEKNFEEVKEKNSSNEALRRWMKLAESVKNPKHHFRDVANLSKPSEVDVTQCSNQYGGSATHNKVFSERRGQPKALLQSQEFRTLPRPEISLGVMDLGYTAFDDESEKMSNCSDFLDVDSLSSSTDSWEEEAYERSELIAMTSIGLATNTVANSMKDESASSNSIPIKHSNSRRVEDDYSGHHRLSV